MSRTSLLRQLFVDHPRSVGESYGEHRAVAWSFGWRMLIGALAAFVHGLFPGLCQTTASRIVRELNARLDNHRR